MNGIGSGHAKPLRRHLQAPRAVTRSTDGNGEADLTRRHGQSNGLRVHGIYFAAVSLVALLLVIVVAAIAATSM